MKKEQKSLRQLARELGVSASYLSQVKNGKRPASQKVLSSVKQGVKQISAGAGGGTRTHKDVTPADFKSAASADSATPAKKLEATTGFEPVNSGFANRRLNHLATSPHGLALLERKTRFELATFSLARKRSTAELLPHLQTMPEPLSPFSLSWQQSQVLGAGGEI